ncbi:hypothetical protein JCM3770_005321 [Rhodotorula araucariae]
MADSALSLPAPAFPPLDNSIGSFLVGTILTVFLAGITSVQSYSYFAGFARTDRKLLVGIVAFLMVVDLFHTGISCYTIYVRPLGSVSLRMLTSDAPATVQLWTVAHYGDIAFLVNSPWSFTWDPFLTGLVAVIVQAFYAWRVYVVSQRRWFIPALIGVFSLLQFAFAIASIWMIYRLDHKFARFGEFRYGVATWLLSAAVADILITGSLVMYLRRATKSDYQTSSRIVERIVRITIETNGLTCIFAIVDAILFVAMPEDSWHVLPNLSLVKLYFNGLLVSLNSRQALQTPSMLGGERKNGSLPGTPAPRYTVTFGSVPNSSQTAQHELTALSIMRTHAEEVKVDSEAEEAVEVRQSYVSALSAGLIHFAPWEQNSQRELRDGPPYAPTAPVVASSAMLPNRSGSRPGTATSREEAIACGAVRADW